MSDELTDAEARLRAGIDKWANGKNPKPESWIFRSTTGEGIFEIRPHDVLTVLAALRARRAQDTPSDPAAWWRHEGEPTATNAAWGRTCEPQPIAENPSTSPGFYREGEYVRPQEVTYCGACGGVLARDLVPAPAPGAVAAAPTEVLCCTGICVICRQGRPTAPSAGEDEAAVERAAGQAAYEEWVAVFGGAGLSPAWSSLDDAAGSGWAAVAVAVAAARSSATAGQLVTLSRWIDEHPVNASRDAEALTWHRVAKVAEEAGEVIEAMIGLSGGNPRKGESHDAAAVIEELLDTAVAALGAVEHLTEHRATSVNPLADKVTRVFERAGLAAARGPRTQDGTTEGGR